MAQRGGGIAYTTRRDAVIRAGAEVFRERGYVGTSLKDVAERLGANRATLYYYFSSKGELFHAVTETAVQEIVQTAERIAESSGTPAERLRDLIVATLTAYERHYPYLFAYIQEDMGRVRSPELDENWAATMVGLGERYERALISIVEDGIADESFTCPDAAIAVYGIIGAVNWTHRWFQPSGRVPADEVGRLFSDLMLRGLERPA